MTNNLHISYELHQPDKNQEALIAAIRALGTWARIHSSFWYINSGLTATQARDNLLSILGPQDSLYVVDVTNRVAAWQNMSEFAVKIIKDRWDASLEAPGLANALT